MIVFAPVQKDIATPKVVLNFFEHSFAFCTLRQNKLWEDLHAKARCRIIDDGYGKASFSIGKSHNPVSCIQSFLLIACTVHIFTVSNSY